MQTEEAITHHVDTQEFNDQVSKTIPHILEAFDRTITSYVSFNMLFLAVGATEFIWLILFFTFLAKSSILAISLAVLFLTLFSYFVLRLYYQNKQPEQLEALCDQFLDECKRRLNYQEGIAEHHLSLANAACRFAAALHDREYHYYKSPSWLDVMDSTVQRFSCWWHWHDIHKMKELMLISSVDEHIKLVKCEPTNLEVHAALANAYVMLSSLYADPRKHENYDDDRWIPPERFAPAMQDQFRAIAARAIEEFKILNDYAPSDPWVHSQLAYSYHDLQMPLEEIKEYETILKLRPDDKETLFKLGMLYFQQGHNAQGLRVYEELKRSHFKKAESLIKFYGSYPVQDLK
jgi:tetratricopeptide (TPR) repeat protein